MLQVQIPAITGKLEVKFGNIQGNLGSNDMMCCMFAADQLCSINPSSQISTCVDGLIGFPEQLLDIKRNMSLGPKSIFFKVSGGGGIPEGGGIKEYAPVQTTIGCFEVPLNVLCQHNAALELSSNSLENAEYSFTLKIHTTFANKSDVVQACRTTGAVFGDNFEHKQNLNNLNNYASDAQRVMLTQMHEWHMSAADISAELREMSQTRKSTISDFMHTLTSEENVKNFDENFVTIPTMNHLMIKELDACQLHYATRSVAIANQNKHVINLLVAAQQTLVDMHIQRYGAHITPATACQVVQDF